MDRLILGDFEFTLSEVPAELPLGGEQMLHVTKNIGGKRHIRTTGRDDSAIEWHGLFIGSTAFSRMRYLDGLRVAGKALLLTYAELRYTVVIKSFKATYLRDNRIKYSISLEVLEDTGSQVNVLVEPSIDGMASNEIEGIYQRIDMSTFDTTQEVTDDMVQDTPLSGFINQVNVAIKSVSGFAKATQAQIDSVLLPIQQARQRVDILIAAVNNTIGNITNLGGLADEVEAIKRTMGNGINLFHINTNLGRLQKLLTDVTRPVKTIRTSANLYQVAVEQYGDATRWTDIAKANNLTDPMLSDLTTLKIPA